MPKETTNVMTLTIMPNNKVETDPPKLRVLADKKEIVLRSAPANKKNIEITFVQDPHMVFAKTSLPGKKVIVKKGGEVRIPIRQDLPLEKRGTFESHHDVQFARGIDLRFKSLTRTEQGDHSDIHIEC